MNKRLRSYLRAYRLRWGFSQRELAYILGLKDRSIVSYLERCKRHPTLAAAFGLYVLFGTTAIELFPALFNEIEESVLTRAYDLFEELQGDSSKLTRQKLDFLEELFERRKGADKDNPDV